MTVYADVVFLLNFFVDFLLLWLTMNVRKQRHPIWRLAIAAFIGAFYAIAIISPAWSWLFTSLTKLVLSALMVIVAFGYPSSAGFLRNWGMFYFISFVVGGGMLAAHYFLLEHQFVVNGRFLTDGNGIGSPITWAFVIIGFPVMWWYSHMMLRTLDERQRIQKYMCTVEMSIAGKSICGTGLIDTGNQLRDPFTRMPVIVAEISLMAPLLPNVLRQAIIDTDVMSELPNIPFDWMRRVKLIPFRGVTQKGDLMVAIQPDKVRISHSEQTVETVRVLVGIDRGKLSADGSYQLIVHPSCLEG